MGAANSKASTRPRDTSPTRRSATLDVDLLLWAMADAMRADNVASAEESATMGLCSQATIDALRQDLGAWRMTWWR